MKDIHSSDIPSTTIAPEQVPTELALWLVPLQEMMPAIPKAISFRFDFCKEFESPRLSAQRQNHA
jgi:hypothetical protein